MTQHNSNKSHLIWLNSISGNLKFWKSNLLKVMDKMGGRRQILKIRLICLQILNMGPISIKQHDMEFLDLWSCENLQLYELRNVNTSTNLIGGIPTTPQHPDSHPCTSSPLGGHERFYSKSGFFTFYVVKTNRRRICQGVSVWSMGCHWNILKPLNQPAETNT